MADSPSAAANMCTKMPQPMPRAAMQPARAPWVALRDMISSESGPGMRLSSRPATMNEPRWWMPNMRASALAELLGDLDELIELGARRAGQDRLARARQAVLDRAGH